MPELAEPQLYPAFHSAWQGAVPSATPASLSLTLCSCTSLSQCQDAVTSTLLPPSVPGSHTGAAGGSQPDASCFSYSFYYLRHLGKLLEVLLLLLGFFLHLRASSLLFVSRDLSVCSKTRTFFFPDKARFLAHSSSIPLNSQSANNSANTRLPSHCLLTLIYERSAW